jgi:hypothetical protein
MYTRKIKHYAVGMKANDSTITRITPPEVSEEGAYINQWHGVFLKKNPRWMNIHLASGKTIKSTDFIRTIADVV